MCVCARATVQPDWTATEEEKNSLFHSLTQRRVMETNDNNIWMSFNFAAVLACRGHSTERDEK